VGLVTIFAVLQLGSTAIGVKTAEGVVLAVEKRITSPLLVQPPSGKMDSLACAMPSSLFVFPCMCSLTCFPLCFLVEDGRFSKLTPG
jgi:Proteasome subunit